jgi:hypothetical protein
VLYAPETCLSSNFSLAPCKYFRCLRRTINLSWAGGVTFVPLAFGSNRFFASSRTLGIERWLRKFGLIALAIASLLAVYTCQEVSDRIEKNN